MGLFSAEQLVAATCDEEQLKRVAADVGDHFNSQGYSISVLPIALSFSSMPVVSACVAGGQQISLHKGGTLAMITGTQLDLRVILTSTAAGTCVQCGVGIIGQQAIATAVSLLLFSPLIIVQLWGLAQQSGVDDQAISVAAASVLKHGVKL
jgi:hypothetical protein